MFLRGGRSGPSLPLEGGGGEAASAMGYIPLLQEGSGTQAGGRQGGVS